MSFDLFIFEKREELKTSLDVYAYLEDFTEYMEKKDYNSLEGCSACICSWAKKMFEKFPPMNEVYGLNLEIAEAKEAAEEYLTDYSLGKNGVYCAFSYSVADEALAYIKSLADEYGVGIYNPQSKETIFAKGIEILKYRTEKQEDSCCDWHKIAHSIASLDDYRRGKSNRDSTFITIWYEVDDTQTNFIQCAPNYKKKGLFSKLFDKEKSSEICGYFFEIEKEGSLYQTMFSDKETLKEVVKQWCIDRKEPEMKQYQKILDL